MNNFIGIIMRNGKSESGADIGILYHKLSKLILKNGGLPIALINDNIEPYLDICNGFILQGGSDIDVKNTPLIQYLHDNNIPLLGICLGMQEMSMVYDGKIDMIDGHKGIIHDVNISSGSILDDICGDLAIPTYSSHNWRITDTSLSVCARSNDSTIEAVYDPRCDFFLGLQWHPESYDDVYSDKIIKRLIRTRSKNR